MTLSSRIKKIGRLAALVAAYALVFNLMLTSTLLASISPLKLNALHELCLNGSSSGQATDDSGNPAKPIIHCPLCVSGAAMADLPPPPPALAIRIAFNIFYEAPPTQPFVAPLTVDDHQPRGPPHLA
ncbi:hypothetical protein V1291_000104 [Nitrobacteraceae bacterium AZCC 1564]